MREQKTYKDIPNGQYMVNRAKRGISRDATLPVGNTTVFAYRDTVFNSNTLPAIACMLHYYDGNAFEGLAYGLIGDYGALIRSESLQITDGIITDAYGTTTPECFKATPDWSATNGYPAAFEGLLQNGDARLGYKDYTSTSFTNYVQGWYAESGRVKYDWQQFDPLTDPPPVGLVVESRDIFENRATIEYDSYSLFPISAKQWLNTSDYLETKAEYDYRVMQPYKITDANDNITEFDFSPLGLLTATAVIGKGTQGDYKSATGTFYERYAPSSRMEYDFFAFIDDGNPVWVKTIQREQHWQDDPDPDSPTIVKVEYSDGFGRLLQTRAQAEDVIFGVPPSTGSGTAACLGSSGLSPDQNMPNSPATGTERASTDPLNVVVSGWKIYNNKGKVVEQYEPFFDKGFDYVLPDNIGVKARMYYDPLQRVVKTVNPDNSEQRMIYGVPNALDTPDDFAPTPWESYSYDANDLAPLTNPGSNVPSDNWYTPKSTLVDALGRTIQTTEHKAHYNTIGAVYEDVVMKYLYDIRGNLLQVKDPYERLVFEHVYDLRAPHTSTGSASGGKAEPLPPLWTKHIDSGISTVVFDATGKPIESEDEKGARSLNSYDTLNRPTNGWTQNNSADTLRLTSYAIYGEQVTTPKVNNLLGKLWQGYNESGKIESIAFDFKGNLLSKQQAVISSTVLKTALDSYQTYLVDWTGLPSILGTQIFETSSEFDALNRATKITLPEDVNTNRKEIIPTYNRAGALEKVSYDNTEYVENIAYNAKGQRLLIAFGNNIMTRYAYDNRTFRLLRQRSEKYVKTQTGNIISYTPQSGTNKQDDAFNFDLVGNILKTLIRVNDCGINGTPLGSDALDRNFDYDPLYRVISADGRESDTQNQNDYLYSDAPAPSTPSANNVRAYTRNYAYDKLGNIQQLKQLGTNGFTRNFTYNAGHNTLQKVETPTPTLIEDFTYDTCGNQLTAGTTRNYVWNAGNQLITYYNQAGSADPTIFAQYDYSGMNRVSKLVKTGTTYERTIYIDGIFEYHILENGTTYEKNYVHVMDDQSRIAMVRVGTPFPDDIADAITYNLEDQIGSSSVRLNTSGTVIDREEYYPFGDSSLRTFTKKRYRYVGKEKDLESGLYYYGARYYAAWTCRFISCDPLSAKYAQLSPYNYADNNPINDYDIDGMQNTNTESSATSTPTEVKAEPAVSTYVEPVVKIDINLIQNKSNVKDFLLKSNDEVKLNLDTSPKELDTSPKEDNMVISQEGIDFIKNYEKLGEKLYNDATGNATIGYGHLVHKGKVGTDSESEKQFKDGITEEKAVELLKQDIKDKAENFVKSTVTVKLTQNQFDALVIFTFNVGGGSLKGSTLLKKINAGETDPDVISKWFKAWNKGTINGKLVELSGLTTRRGQEADIYNKNVYNSTH